MLSLWTRHLTWLTSWIQFLQISSNFCSITSSYWTKTLSNVPRSQYTLCPAAWTHLLHQVLYVITWSLHIPSHFIEGYKEMLSKTTLKSDNEDISPASHLVFKLPVTCRSISVQRGLLPPGRHFSIHGPWVFSEQWEANRALGLFSGSHQVALSLTFISHWFLRLDNRPIKFSHLSRKREGLFVGSHWLD